MFKRVTLGVAAISSLLVVPVWGQAKPGGDVTLVLQSGEKVIGELASYDQATIDIRGRSGQRRTIPMADAALIDFAGTASTLPAAEVSAAIEQTPLVVLRDGTRLRGAIVDFVNEGGPEATLVFDASPGGRRDLKLDGVARLYVRAPSDAVRVAVGVPPATATTLPAPAPATQRSFTVPGNARWIDTGIVVGQGDRVDFAVEGTVYLQPGQLEPAGPSGAQSGLRTPTGPLPGQAAGALVGRIGERGQAFGIGGQPSLMMPESGRLYLGVNDGEPDDNTGQFTVKLTHHPSPTSNVPRRRR